MVMVEVAVGVSPIIIQKPPHNTIYREVTSLRNAKGSTQLKIYWLSTIQVTLCGIRSIGRIWYWGALL